MSGMEPILIGAAVGAGTSALMGGNPLKGAVLGGAGGGLGSAAGLFGSAGGVGSGAASVVPAAAEGAAGQAGLIFNPATGSFLNPEYYALVNSANPIFTGAGGLGSQLTTGIGSLLDTSTVQGLKDYLPSGQAMTNLGISSAMQPRPTAMAPAGGITAGRAPDMAAIEQLITKRKKPAPSLLGDYFG